MGRASLFLAASDQLPLHCLKLLKKVGLSWIVIHGTGTHRLAGLCNGGCDL